MTPLSPGAVQLPRHHLSVRVPGTTPTGPAASAGRRARTTRARCSRTSRSSKIDVVEDEVAGRPGGNSTQEVPPCVLERAGFMRTGVSYPTRRVHPYKERQFPSHAHFAPTIQRMPKYSVEAIPFRWVRRDSYELYSQPWGIEVDEALERAGRSGHGLRERLDPGPAQPAGDARLVLLGAPSRDSRLVLLYVKDLPLSRRAAGGRAVPDRRGFVTRRRPRASTGSTARRDQLRSIMWERGVVALDPARLQRRLPAPLPAAAERPGAFRRVDLSEYVARTPGDHFDEFSYVSELVSDDASDRRARGARPRRRPDHRTRSTGRGSKRAPGSATALAEAWQARGPYPGLGPMLAAAGHRAGRAARPTACSTSCPTTPTRGRRSTERRSPRNRDGLVGRTAPQGVGEGSPPTRALPAAAGHVAVRAHRRAGPRACSRHAEPEAR